MSAKSLLLFVVLALAGFMPFDAAVARAAVAVPSPHTVREAGTADMHPAHGLRLAQTQYPSTVPPPKPRYRSTVPPEKPRYRSTAPSRERLKRSERRRDTDRVKRRDRRIERSKEQRRDRAKRRRDRELRDRDRSRRRDHDRRRRRPSIYFEFGPYYDYPREFGPGYYDPYYRPYYDPPAIRRRISCNHAMQLVRNAGYRRVRATDCRGKVYGFTAWRGGKRYKLRVSSRTGAILSRRRF